MNYGNIGQIQLRAYTLWKSKKIPTESNKNDAIALFRMNISGHE